MKLLYVAFLFGLTSCGRADTSTLSETPSGERVVGLWAKERYYPQVFTTNGNQVFQTRISDQNQVLPDTRRAIVEAQLRDGETILDLFQNQRGYSYLISQLGAEVFSRLCADQGTGVGEPHLLATVDLTNEERLVGLLDFWNNGNLQLAVANSSRLALVPLSRFGTGVGEKTYLEGTVTLEANETISGLAWIRGYYRILSEVGGRVSFTDVSVPRVGTPRILTDRKITLDGALP
jgi:hypothetical protein